MRSFSSGSQVSGQSAMYVEPFEHQMTVAFNPTMTFQPFDSGVTVATTSTTSGAKILAFGSQAGTPALRAFTVQRSVHAPASLQPVPAGTTSFPGVSGGAVGGD